jgi:hypothetical protein
MRESSASESLAKHRKRVSDDIKTGRCPVLRRPDSYSGFCTELENLDGDGKGKGTSGKNREAESTDAPTRGGLLGSSDEAG